MKGMNQSTGLSIGGNDHLKQSIARILTTPEGSRIGRRDFGSPLFSMVDAPSTPATRVRLFAATAGALLRWEPRFKVTRIGFTADLSGTAVISVEGISKISNDAVSVSVPMKGAQ
jgi:phage baseplate assembly protein W